MLSFFLRNIICNGIIGKYCEDFNNKIWFWFLRYELRLLCKILEFYYFKVVYLSFWFVLFLCNFVYVECSWLEIFDLGSFKDDFSYGRNEINEINF